MEKIILDYDVCVIGGGVGGIAAALASARSNKRTILVEANYIVGGLATSGLVSIYLPLDDGYGHQISYGICDELFKLSKVQTQEQKLILKGKTLIDSTPLSSIPNNSTLSMLGAAPPSADKPVPAPSKVMFLEDLTEEQKLQIQKEKGEEIVFGLTNLGNTCFLNATVQCIGRVPELRNALKEFMTNAKASNVIDNSVKFES